MSEPHYNSDFPKEFDALPDPLWYTKQRNSTKDVEIVSVPLKSFHDRVLFVYAFHFLDVFCQAFDEKDSNSKRNEWEDYKDQVN